MLDFSAELVVSLRVFVVTLGEPRFERGFVDGIGAAKLLKRAVMVADGCVDEADEHVGIHSFEF